MTNQKALELTIDLILLPLRMGHLTNEEITVVSQAILDDIMTEINQMGETTNEQ